MSTRVRCGSPSSARRAASSAGSRKRSRLRSIVDVLLSVPVTWLPVSSALWAYSVMRLTLCAADGVQPAVTRPPSDAVSVPMPAGAALVYLGSLWHGGGANRTDRVRLGVVLHYAVSWLRPVENHVLAVPPETARTLPVRLQELLGYNVHPPFLGYVDGRHPGKLLVP